MTQQEQQAEIDGAGEHAVPDDKDPETESSSTSTSTPMTSPSPSSLPLVVISPDSTQSLQSSPETNAIYNDDDNFVDNTHIDFDHIAAAWEWFRSHNSPKYWVAPLVGLSDPSFRVLCRRYGATVAHTEMADPGGFVHSEYYRSQLLGKQQEDRDRPLVLQLGGSRVDKLLEAVKFVVSQNHSNNENGGTDNSTLSFDAVELNCGCPQQCARKGGYGAFLLEDLDKLCGIIQQLRRALPPSMPLLVKMRVFDSMDRTVMVAQRIVAAGAGILTVHGRTRHQGGGKKTAAEYKLASWPHIRAVKRAVPVPVIANGNVLDWRAVPQILEATECDGVMSGCGLLRDPTLFAKAKIAAGENDDEVQDFGDYVTIRDDVDDTVDMDVAWKEAVAVAREYIELAIHFQTHPTRVSKHLIWMLDRRGGWFKAKAPELRNRTIDLRFIKFRKDFLEHCYHGCNDGDETTDHPHKRGVAGILQDLSEELLKTTM